MSPRLLLLFFPLFAAAAQPALQFKDTDLVVKATTQDKELKAHYPFTNSGSSPVWIVQVTTSCGCTTAATDKTELQPGESGTLTATYTIGLSQGRHTHTINVQTSEPNAPPYALKITAELPTGTTPLAPATPLATLAPRELVWSRAPYAAKTIEIAINHSEPAKLSATCDSDQFELKLDDTVRPARLQVTPRPSAISLRAEITLQISSASAPSASLKIPLTVLSLKRP